MSDNTGILICDLFPVRGHRFLNTITVEALSNYNLTVCTERDYFDEALFSSQIKVLHHPKVRSKIQFFKCLRYTLNLIRLLYKNNYSKVLVLTYEIRSFTLVKLFAGKYLSRIHIMQHYNIDALNRSRVNSLCFNSYSKRVKHIVLQYTLEKQCA